MMGLVRVEGSRSLKALVAALLALAALAAHAQERVVTTFGVIADAPYDAAEARWLEDLFARLEAEPLAVVVHAGDMKNGSSPCSDALFAAHRRLFDRSPHPLVYVPGDNDWTDCWRPAAGGHDPRERLAALRRVFFASSTSLGRRTLALSRQPEYPENTRWRLGPVTFAGFNIPGPDNNYLRMPAEYAARNAANLEWLAATFAEAREHGARAIVLVMQGNMFPAPPAASAERRLGYADFLAALQVAAAEFAGSVLVVNGETHHQRHDRPLADVAGRPLANVERVEGYGSPFLGWVRVTVVETPDGRLAFRVEPRPETL
jgi:hypothetical protein